VLGIESEATKETVARQSIKNVRDLAIRVRENVQRVIVGKSESIDLAVIALLCRGHVLIEDVPGTGKTTLAKALAASLNCEFHRIQFTPDLVPSDVLGINYFNMRSGEFEFRPGPIFSQVLLADEINRATPRTQSALLEAMQERQASIDGVTSPLPDPFIVMATLNPIEMEGTFPLPEAQLDRFLLRVNLGYPTLEEESAMLMRFQSMQTLDTISSVAGPEEILEAQQAVEQVRMEPNVRDYLLAIIAATRTHSQLRLGASPRASLSLQHAAQARAAMADRDYVIPDDIKEMANPVLAHRVVIESSAGLRGRTRDNVISEILGSIKVPIER
jgi:MoxR-like ATPase